MRDATAVKYLYQGFTLIELLVTLAVAAVLLAIAVPGLRSILLSNRLATTANDVVNALDLTRSEAVKRNSRVDFNADGSVSITAGAATTVIAGAVALPPNISLGSVQALQGTPTGFLQTATGTGGFTGLVGDVGTSGLSSNNHRCIYLATGVATSTCVVSGACPNAQPNPCSQ